MRRSLLVILSLLVFIGAAKPQEVHEIGATHSSTKVSINPKQVKRVKFPKYEDLADDLRKLLERSHQDSSFEGKTGPTLYEALGNIRKAGLLNIFKKAENTPLSNGRPVSAYLQSLTRLQGDRVFAVVQKELHEQMKDSVAADLFYPASQLLHHPPSGYRSVGSFKTHDRYGNLQLSFFLKGDDCVVDIDIDDAAGFEHTFQVLRNALTRRPTHPFAIRQILITYQSLNPGYSLEF